MLYDRPITIWMYDCLQTGKPSVYDNHYQPPRPSIPLAKVKAVCSCVGSGNTVIPYSKWCPVALRWSYIKSCILLFFLT